MIDHSICKHLNEKFCPKFTRGYHIVIFAGSLESAN